MKENNNTSICENEKKKKNIQNGSCSHHHLHHETTSLLNNNNDNNNNNNDLSLSSGASIRSQYGETNNDNSSNDKTRSVKRNDEDGNNNNNNNDDILSRSLSVEEEEDKEDDDDDEQQYNESFIFNNGENTDEVHHNDNKTNNIRRSSIFQTFVVNSTRSISDIIQSLRNSSSSNNNNNNISNSQHSSSFIKHYKYMKQLFKWIILFCILFSLLIHRIRHPKYPRGIYVLKEYQKGYNFFNSYIFYNGPDSTGSAGNQTYVGPRQRAIDLGLANVTLDENDDKEYIYLNSIVDPNDSSERLALRLEGLRRYNRGLFIADIKHVPNGCGMWPAFWLTDDNNWPKNGEIDIIESTNYQTRARAALHTSEGCTMWGHVPESKFTGTWDRATCLPDWYTGKTDCKTNKPADDCWAEAPHQWYNEGCAISSEHNNTIGQPFNRNGGGVYVLEWDDYNGYIRFWIFTPHETIPQNLLDSMNTATYPKQMILSNTNSDHNKGKGTISPDPNSWNVKPFAYFAIGNKSACPLHHFQNMKIIFNLALCGSFAGNNFLNDCSYDIVNKFRHPSNNPVLSCNDYIASNPIEIQNESYWKIKGIYVYERQWE